VTDKQQISDEEIGERFRTLIDRLVPTVSPDQVMSKPVTIAERRRHATRYRGRAIAWVAIVALLVVALVAGVHAATAGKPKGVTPAGRSAHLKNPGKIVGHPSAPHVPKVRIDISSTTSTTLRLSTGTTTRVGSTETTVVPTTTTVPSASTPLFVSDGFLGRKPTDIYLSGDAGNVVTNLSWSVWSTEEAIGDGTSNYLTCNPNCASGPAYPEHTSITLSDPVDGKFTKMTEVKAGVSSVYFYGHQWAEWAS
jgi:hypothetical protein